MFDCSAHVLASTAVSIMKTCLDRWGDLDLIQKNYAILEHSFQKTSLRTSESGLVFQKTFLCSSIVSAFSVG